MEKIDLSTYKVQNKTKTAHRFQEIACQCIKNFGVDSKGKGLLWGRISFLKQKGLTNKDIEYHLSRLATEVEQIKPKKPGRYFVKAFYSIKI